MLVSRRRRVQSLVLLWSMVDRPPQSSLDQTAHKLVHNLSQDCNLQCGLSVSPEVGRVPIENPIFELSAPKRGFRSKPLLVGYFRISAFWGAVVGSRGS